MLLLFIDNERTESPTSSPRSLLACKDLTVPFLQECCLLSPLHPKDNLGSKVSQAAQGTAVIITHLLWWCVKQDSGRGRMWWLRLSARWCSHSHLPISQSSCSSSSPSYWLLLCFPVLLFSLNLIIRRVDEAHLGWIFSLSVVFILPSLFCFVFCS